MYNVEFDGKNPNSVAFYEVLYEGWLLGSHLDQTRGPLNNQQWSWMDTVKESEITDQFRKIGQPLSCGRKTATGDQALTLSVEGPCMMEFTHDQFNTIVRRFQLVPWAVAKLPDVVRHFKTLIAIKDLKSV